jgi:hypothetical protein
MVTSWTTCVDEPELINAILDSTLIRVTNKKKGTAQALWNKRAEKLDNSLPLEEYC